MTPLIIWGILDACEALPLPESVDTVENCQDWVWAAMRNVLEERAVLDFNWTEILEEIAYLEMR